MREPDWIGEAVAVRLARALCTESRETYRLDSHAELRRALAVPQERYDAGEGDLARRAAHYIAEIAQRQPFHEGNKRTGTAVAGAFLAVNGRPPHRLRAERTLAEAVIDAKEGRIGAARPAKVLEAVLPD